MHLEILDARSKKSIKIAEVSEDETIKSLKEKVYKSNKSFYPDRQSFRIEPRGTNIPDNEKIGSLKLDPDSPKLYLKDLGPQIGWKTVFILEYFGPLVIYLAFYTRPSFIYGHISISDLAKPMSFVTHLACICYTFHFTKRLFETQFIHRFSHSTMPLNNLFKNCGYYWMFAAFIAYFNNHPLYTEPSFGASQIFLGFTIFALSELGNFSIHLAFRKMRSAGSKERKIPMPTSNPFTKLFKYVSCPNYSYEVYAWVGFSIMCQSLPAVLFTLAGFYQMAVWAMGKHKAYKNEFPKYPKGRKAIIPFLI